MTTAAAAGETSKEYLGMSDEDFLNINSPEAAPVAAADDTDTSADTGESGDKNQEGPHPGSEKSDEEKAAEAAAEESETEAEKQAREEEEREAAEAEAAADKAKKPADPGSKTKDETWKEYEPDTSKSETENAALKAEHDKTKPAEKTVEGADPKDGEKPKSKRGEDQPVEALASFYNQIMTPFKANGRTIELKTPEEAIRLMQMGAGYGRKIQDLQPHLKVLRMLEKNELLDEGKLSFLIDINSNNVDAIKKKIKDAGIDPLDLNIEDNVGYQPKSHAVSDQEMAFQEALSDIQSHESGQETLKTINQTWDKESKQALWDQPQILGVIQSQRENGIYDQIVAEIDRQKLLGKIPHSAPFLQAYRAAGDILFPPAAQTPQVQTQTGETPQPQVIATRAEAPKTQVKNSDKAAAAAETKSAGKAKGGPRVNPLEMADDDFLKQFNGRL